MNTILINKGLWSGVLLLTSWSATAQQRKDTTIAAQTIEIIQSYKPEIAKPIKPVITPTLPYVDTSKPKFQYEVPQQTLDFTYNSVPIKPLAMGKMPTETSFQNYVKAAYGNLNTLNIDAGVGSLNGANYESAFHFSHLSQKGSIVNQQSSLTDFDAKGKYFMEGHAIGASVGVLRNAYRYYGYDHSLFSYDNKDIKQVFTGAQVSVSAENTTSNSWGINYQPSVHFGMYNDKYDAKEKSFGFNAPFQYHIDSSVLLSLGVQGNFNQYKKDSTSIANNVIQLSPALDFSVSNFKFHISARPTWGKQSIFYVLPDISIKTATANNHLSIVGGWRADLLQNTFQQLSTKNPYLWKLNTMQQTKSDQVYAGFESALGSHISFGGTVSWRQWKHAAIFVNDYWTSMDSKNFQVIYDDKIQALSLDAFIRYQIGNTFGLSAFGVWNNFYKTTTLDKAFHEPMMRLGGNLYARPVKDWVINVNAEFWDGIYTLQSTGDAKKLSPLFDLSMSTEYNIIPRLSILLQANNILGVKYERWNQYQAYGFNIMGGLRFKF
jgi:hypothetical protein